MIKVVYFDDSSATDYLNIYDGGQKIQTKDDIENKNRELANRTMAGVYAKLSWLPFFGGSAKTDINTNISIGGSSLIKTTLANTVLTDFLEKSKQDKRVVDFSDFKLKAYKNSITYLKMFTPYLKMTKWDFTTDDGVVLDISKIDDVFKNSKGYYELIAEKESEKYILRFNINSFRNNYGISDLIKMNLRYLAIKVGATEEEMLNISKEFNFEQKSVSSAFDIVDEKENIKSKLLGVYDVILAGVDI
ncbi:DUF6414 family protein [Clostridium felsineum]|uniref:Uncharacterized protein n=1 Tax=Clostridium felsineum TaxID=36839 RepID=A0A1S8KYE7_9CLOT|nr:DUF6414 family protein [Clostridium felsineum]URZ05952.1 hypothetical protein CLROS_012840 [Clostridium felsineum]URZ10989.1 hypothetical protein CROST_017050 [Clostridium felsineum]